MTTPLPDSGQYALFIVVLIYVTLLLLLIVFCRDLFLKKKDLSPPMHAPAGYGSRVTMLTSSKTSLGLFCKP